MGFGGARRTNEGYRSSAKYILRRFDPGKKKRKVKKRKRERDVASAKQMAGYCGGGVEAQLKR